MAMNKSGFTNKQTKMPVVKAPKPKSMTAIKMQSKPAVKPGNGTVPKAYGTSVKTK